MEIINMQMRHYLHNGKGYRALPYQIKAYVVCFPAIYKTNFFIFVTYITFSQSRSQLWICRLLHHDVMLNIIIPVIAGATLKK